MHCCMSNSFLISDYFSTFFLGVKQSLSSAVRPEEVGFQINYSRSVLKNIIKQYPLKDVRRSVEHYLNKVIFISCLEIASRVLIVILVSTFP